MHPSFPDLSAIAGQEHAKRALEVAATGGHSLVLTGGPGLGKTLLARALAGLLPPLTPDEGEDLRRWVTRQGEPEPGWLEMGQRPVLAGQEALAWVEEAPGGQDRLLGGIQHGILLLERLDCFGYSPLQIERLALALDHGQDVQLVLTMQPCPCGFYGDPTRECDCSARLIIRHHRRMRALIDRAPIAVEIPRLDEERQRPGALQESSAQVVQRVRKGAQRQYARFAGLGITRNAAMDHALLQQCCVLEASAQKLLRAACQQLHLSMRARESLLAVARTIADLADSDQIQANHLAEAIQYQPRP